MRTIIIGDVHGCDKALNALIKKAAPAGDDRLILLGDLFDRGPASRDVFQTVRKLEARFADRFALLRGNHEDYLLQEKLTLSQRLVWERVGRGATVRSFREHGEQMEDARPWLNEHCRLFYRDETIQCVHAGLMVDPIEANDTQTIVHDHGIVLKNIYQGRLTVVGHIALEKSAWFAGDGKTVKELECGVWRELPEKGVLCIDTGCGKGGRLTTMILEDRKYRLESVHESGF